MSSALIAVLVILIAMLVLGSPVVLAIATAGISYFLIKPDMLGSLTMYVHKFYTGMDSFVFLAIPLFILVGELLSQGKMMDQLVQFSQLIVGRFRGGLAHVNVFGSMLFGGVSGSGLADVSALGPIQVKMMHKAGYKKEFAAALTATSAIQGPIIPPSIPLVIFAGLTNVSVGALFLGGIIPGILIGLAQMILIVIMAKRKGFPKEKQDFTLKNIIKVTSSAITALMLPVIIIGGILGGFFTPTEAAAIAVAYAFIINAVTMKKIDLRATMRALNNTIRLSASIYLIIGFTSVISYILAIERIPSLINDLVVASNVSPYLLLFIVNIFFLLNGMWISDVAQLLLFAPIFTPIFAGMGVDPVHFGVVMVVNVMISMITPPYGMALYLAAAISDSKLSTIVKEAFPFLLVSIAVLFLITYVPSLVMFLPNLFN
ncbi:TRAP transporter large permease [Savagea sp. SN6]|uniref:TRAP transporter large permease n=1 Tax=Savagea serpentis TaxID=2785297 RepID=A0A8J7G3G0_9BACL|nr:TRAP transporter large permease [Savagea serpentis]MBF4500457.1 TRAP transporter large permease [Savagea serpentis]